MLKHLNVDGIGPDDLILNGSSAAAAHRQSAARRVESDRPSDLPLIRRLLGPPTGWPTHPTTGDPLYRRIRPGVFTADLPPDAFKLIWITPDGFTVATYRTPGIREGGLIL